MIGSIQIVRWKADDHTVLRVADVKTPWGTALVVMHDASIVEWWFSTFEASRLTLTLRWPHVQWLEDDSSVIKMVEAIFSADLIVDIHVALKGTDFQFGVWQALMTIPSGSVATYADVARSIGRATAVRAVANAIGQNPVSYLVPCHRVVRTNGSLGGYRWGDTVKAQLLQHEKALTNFALSF